MLDAFVFAAMSLPLSAQTEAESLAFLYKNMSTPDSVDYPKSYWQKQVRMALKARSQMAWGRSVPRWEFGTFRTSCASEQRGVGRCARNHL